MKRSAGVRLGVRQMCVDVRTACGNNVHVVPGIGGSYCDSCTGRETEGRRREMAVIACGSGDNPSWI